MSYVGRNLSLTSLKVGTVTKPTIFKASGSAGYTGLDTDGFDHIWMTSNYQYDLPLAANNIGREITIYKATSSNNAVTIARQSSDQIYQGGAQSATSVALDFEGESVTLVAKDANTWLIKSWYIPSPEYTLSTTCDQAGWTAQRKTGSVVKLNPLNPTYYLNASIAGIVNSGIRTGAIITIANVIFALDVTGTNQPASGYVSGGGSSYAPATTCANNNGNVVMDHISATTIVYQVTCSMIRLKQKPGIIL